MQQKGYQVTWAQAVRDVLTTTMNRGQLLLLILLLAGLLILSRLSEDDLALLVFQFARNVKNGYLVGYILATILVIGWYWDGRRLRKNYAEISTLYQKSLSNQHQKKPKSKK